MKRSLSQFEVPFFLVGVAGFALLFFGAVHVWSRAIVMLAIFGFGLAAAVRVWGRGPAPTVSGEQRLADPFTVAGVFLIAWGLVQLIPLPAWVVTLVSPEAARIWESVGGTPRLSLYPFMTLDALLLGFAFLVFYRIALGGLEERVQIRWVVVGILALGLFESVYGLFQLAEGRNTILWWENRFSGNVVTGTFINRNHLAGFLSMAICVGIGYLWSLGRQVEQKRLHRHRRRRHHGPRLRDRLSRLAGEFGLKGLLTALTLALMLAAMLASASRGGVLSLICGVVFMLGLILARWFRDRRWFSLMVVLALVMSYVGYAAADRLVVRLASLDSGLADRLALAKNTWAMAKDFPLTGAGAGTFEFVFPAYQQVHLNRIVDFAHNDWVQLLAEFGWPGLLAAVAALAAFLVLAIGKWRQRHDAFGVGVGIGGIGAVVAISVHSLSDFNLHIPANVLVLALVVALTLAALRGPDEKREEGDAGEAVAAPIPERRSRLAAVALPALAVAILAAFWLTVQTWRADALARTFVDSTNPAQVPAPAELRKARGITPGNADYWLMTSRRLLFRPAEKGELLTPEEAGLPDPLLALCRQGLKQSPASWRVWRELGWSRFMESASPGRDRDEALKGAVLALTRASLLRPADPRLLFESGTVALAACAAGVAGVTDEDWKGAFSRALAMEPALTANIVDMMILYLGAGGAKIAGEVLPADAGSRLAAATFLIGQGFRESGMALYRDGAKMREIEAGELWENFKANGRWMNGKKGGLMQKAAGLDPGHPAVRLMRGQLIQALQAMERRGEPMGKWWSTRSLAARLTRELEAGRGDPVAASYYLGLIAQEEGDRELALRWFNRTVSLQGQHFPAWLHLRELTREKARSEADKIQLGALEKRIDFFAMEAVVPDAWRTAGRREGRPAWRAPFRLAEPAQRVAIRFSADSGGVWALDVDGRFLDIWEIGGQLPYFKTVEMAIPAGEHEFGLTTWNAAPPADGKDLPFRLDLSWK